MFGIVIAKYLLLLSEMIYLNYCDLNLTFTLHYITLFSYIHLHYLLIFSDKWLRDEIS